MSHRDSGQPTWRSSLRRVVIALFFMTGCGGESTAVDGGTTSSSSSSGSFTGLAISGYATVSDVDVGENATAITVTRDGHPVSGAEVSAGAAKLVESSTPGVYGVVDQPPPPPDGFLRIIAVKGADSEEGSASCPAGVTLSAPADGTKASAGDTIHVTWKGALADSRASSEPEVDICPLGPDGNEAYCLSGGPSTANLTSAEHAVDVKVPAAAGGGWIVNLRGVGDMTTTPGAQVECLVVWRAHLQPLP